jgi:hypothetical protein
MIHLTLFTGIQYIKFTAVGERAVHMTITKKICHNAAHASAVQTAKY